MGKCARRGGRTADSPSDEILISRFRAGDEKAFSELLNRHSPRLRARVRRRLPAVLNRKVAESDVLQDAYLGVHRRLDTFEDRGEGSFRRWLAGIVDNKIRDVLRRYFECEKRGRDRELSRADRVATRDMATRVPTPSANASANELREQVRAALDRLSPVHRQAIRLIQEEGLPLAEAAERMGRSPEAVRKLFARAVSRLAELSGAVGEGECDG